MSAKVTIQYELAVSRRGQMTTTVKEKTFSNELTYAKWLEKNDGRVTVLRTLSQSDQDVEDHATHDPHCTCNDCMADYIQRLS